MVVAVGGRGAVEGVLCCQQFAHPYHVLRQERDVGQLLDLPATDHAHPSEPAELLEPAVDLFVELVLLLADLVVFISRSWLWLNTA